MKIETLKDSILIDNRYQMYSNGVIYDTTQAKDIPLYIFEFRDFILKNYNKMKDQIDIIR